MTRTKLNKITQPWQTFLVGGAVRDQLLGLQTHDQDWVVVGASQKDMIAAGFLQVGQDFPVFLHPDTKEEYALARKEQKTGPGYQGFEFDTSKTVSLEQDLKRRDLTINAMAMNDQGDIIDPYNGQADLQLKLLRHVSNAFIEDPLRVLRVARFYARFHHLGFQIAPETLELMTQLSHNGDLANLAPERIWLETKKALNEQNPAAYFEILLQVGALQVLLPELAVLDGVPQSPQWHPEIDTFIHVMQALKASRYLTDDTSVHLAVLLHDLGKGITPQEMLPKHIMHEKNGIPLVKAVCDRLKVSRAEKDLALKVCLDHLHFHLCFEMRASRLLALLKRLDAFRQPQVFQQWLIACEADKKGRGETEAKWKERLTDILPNTAFFHKIHAAADKIQFKDLPSGLTGAAIGKALDQLRIQAIQGVIEGSMTDSTGAGATLAPSRNV